ncbi:MAG TPA: hypothetical protein DD423_06340, partial [Opitutae bacterium]|nr:hypothetical protein [Opitutae bacterium]
DQISSTEKVHQLRMELSTLHNDPRFMLCHSMGDLTFLNMSITLGLFGEDAFLPEGASDS